MRYMLITGDHPRHLYFASRLAEQCDLVSLLLERRESFVPTPPDDLDENSKKNFIRHFSNRAYYEKKYFGDAKVFPKVPYAYVGSDDLLQITKTLEEVNPDVIFVFGTLSLASKLQKTYAENVKWINLNTGLMQRYNGVATLFWPFYFLEPQWAGSTFHMMDGNENEVAILHQCVPKLSKGDTIHEVSAKVVVASANDVAKIIDSLENERTKKYKKVKLVGKMFENSDFKAENLRVIYELFDDNIVDCFLDGTLGGSYPELIEIKQ